MISIKEDIDIKDLHSFGISFINKFWIDFDDPQELIELLAQEPYKSAHYQIIGSGSNLLFLSAFRGSLLHPVNKEITVTSETKTEIIIEADAGLEWDSLVEWAVKHEYYGIENLSHIPGTVGGAVVQNIGAYGTEIKQLIIFVEAINLETGKKQVFNSSQCDFSYRDSIFKRKTKKSWLVWKAQFRLSKIPKFNLAYGNLAEHFKSQEELCLANLRQLIIKTRQNKLPDPKVLGNAGSFFKNPVITRVAHEKLLIRFPNMPSFPTNMDGFVKIPAAWLIERAGYKGYRENDAGVYEKHSLVLVNYGNATSLDIFQLALRIQVNITRIFGIQLEREVIVMPSSFFA